MKSKLIVNCQQANLKNSGGLGRYAAVLAKNAGSWARTQGIDFELTGLPDEKPDRVERQWLRSSKEVAKLILPTSSQRLIRRILYPPINIAEEFQNFEEPDHAPTLIHDLSNFFYSPLVGRQLNRPSFRYVVTFLDLQDFYYPQFFSDHQLSHRRVLYEFFRNQATSFIAISEHTKKTMVECLSIPPELIEVIYLGANIEDVSTSAQFAKFSRSLGNYLIYPAKPWIHKNHDFLFRSVQRLKADLKAQEMKLVLTGGFTEIEKRRTIERLRELGVSDLVHITGFLTDSELRYLIQGARAMVFPSLFEGFGMPVVEAQILSCPVICSNTGSLKEVAGDSAVYFNPHRSEEIDEAIRIFMRPDFDREGITAAGRINAARFNWDSCKNATYRHYLRELQNVH